MKEFEISLPKWTRMLVVGENITEKQALEIIRRTDKFFDMQNGGGSKEIEDFFFISNLKTYEDYLNWNRLWGTLNLEFCKNDYIFTDYPSGWCSPSGKICSLNLLDRYPTVEEIYNEWRSISEEFNYLNLKVTLLSEENPLINLKISKGEVNFTGDYNLFEKFSNFKDIIQKSTIERRLVDFKIWKSLVENLILKKEK